jgi:hypothetical protein
MMVGDKIITGLHRTPAGWTVDRGTPGSVMVGRRSFEVRARFLVAGRSSGAVLRISDGRAQVIAGSGLSLRSRAGIMNSQKVIHGSVGICYGRGKGCCRPFIFVFNNPASIADI